MKKFLFTLAAVLVAGSAFAAPRIYMDQLNITEAMVGTNIQLPVKMTTDVAISAGTVKVELPEGLVLRKIDKGSSIANLTYFDDYGDEWTADNTIFTPAVATQNFAFATVDKGYYEAEPGVWVEYGAVKFLPGQYDEMAVLTIRVNAVPDDQVVVMHSELSCGNDTRPWVETLQGLGVSDEEVPVNPAPAQEFVGTANVEFVGNVANLSYTSNDPNATVAVTVNNQPETVTWENGQATWTAPENTASGTYTYTVVLTVTPSDDYEGDAVSDQDTYTYTIKPTFDALAEVVFDENGVATLSYVANDPNAVPSVTVNNEAVNIAFVNGEATWTAPQNTAPGDYSYTVVLTVTPSEAYDGDAVSAQDTYSYTILPMTDAPVIQFIREGEYAAQFIITNDYADGTEIHVYVDGVEIGLTHDELADDDTYWIIAEIDQDVEHEITVTAQEPGKQQNSTTETYVMPGRPDSVNELVNGKTVAGVRFFNMAGQEMQEANGMTIVVTTYTDGTTSAVKVMK